MTQIELVEAFYAALAANKPEEATNLYHPQVTFQDPAFGTLQGERAKAMWHMLLKRAKGQLSIKLTEVRQEGHRVVAHWQADYPYGPKQRMVHNEVDAVFTFTDGKIFTHTDTFDLWRWTQQALGLPGYLLGWSSVMKSTLQRKTNQLLDRFISSR